MTEAEFSDWALTICSTGLILFLAFIVWDLAKKSKAGKLGTFILFLALGLGVVGYIIKNILVSLLSK